MGSSENIFNAVKYPKGLRTRVNRKNDEIICTVQFTKAISTMKRFFL